MSILKVYFIVYDDEGDENYGDDNGGDYDDLDDIAMNQQHVVDVLFLCNQFCALCK